MLITPVILCGGSGTRMWPLSRSRYPKQFHRISGDQTLLEATIRRVQCVEGSGAPLAVCADEFRFLTAEQFRLADAEGFRLILEPCPRNTAPAIVAAAHEIIKNNQPSLMLVLPADHVISDVDAFVRAVAAAVPAAKAGKLVTFGIKPDAPETGYGYIKSPAASEGVAADVDSFIEKPDLQRAQAFLEAGDYYWNSGMFLFEAQTWLNSVEQFAPEIGRLAKQSFDNASEKFDSVELEPESFENCPSESIDYAVMEHTNDAVVMPLDAGWCDVGSWKGVWQVGQQDENQNVTRGDVRLNNVNSSCVYSDGRLIVVNQLDNVAVIDTKDVTYVTSLDASQEVKKIVSELEMQGRPEVEFHTRVFRPWGSFETIDKGQGFQVKRLMLNPGAEISLQYHHHRSEHWVVVRGVARVQKDEEVFELKKNESVDIPVKTIHQLSNPGTEALELIEVQTGSYLGEDDIVRLEDRYGRVEKEES